MKSIYSSENNSLEDIDSLLSLQTDELEKLNQIIAEHPMRITSYYRSLINWDDLNDPIRKMAFPSVNELRQDGVFDTSGEEESTKIRGLQHKYQETALILTTGKCAVYCRHCFRKRLVGLENSEVAVDWDGIVDYIQQHHEISNVLLSGGDPLTLSNEDVEDMLAKVTAIEHLSWIRIGSRIPVVLPERISEDKKLLQILKDYAGRGRQIYLTTQFNHPREITEQSHRAVNALKKADIIVNNQTVLLKGVNDNPGVMADLQRDLTTMGVVPYYIFQCRPVSRVKHSFQVSIREGCEIIEKTRSLLGGLSKRFRYVMSHYSGKIEILGIRGDEIFMKYHQARDSKQLNELFSKKLHEIDGWLD